VSDAEVQAVRVGPGSYLLAAEQIHVGLVFVVAGQRYEVIGEPTAIGGDRYFAAVRRPDGGRLTAQLQVGHKVS